MLFIHCYITYEILIYIFLTCLNYFSFPESGVDNPAATTCRTTPVSTTTSAVGVTLIGNKECASCGKRITERFLLKAIDLFWHEDCLKCGCCDCRLGEVGSTLYTKANLLLCKRDYLRFVNFCFGFFVGPTTVFFLIF